MTVMRNLQSSIGNYLASYISTSKRSHGTGRLKAAVDLEFGRAVGFESFGVLVGWLIGRFKTWAFRL